jgi:hypothetical protein
MSDSSDGSDSQKLSRRKFLLSSSATVAGAAVATSGITLLSERAEAFFNMGAFWKKPAGNGQTSNGYSIGQSLRFSSANTAYFNRTPATAGNRQTWTLSCWVKRSGLGTAQGIFCSGINSNDFDTFQFGTDDKLYFYFAIGNAWVGQYNTTSVFRDPSAWYHIVVQTDTTQGTAANKLRVYVNGTQQALTTSTALGTQSLYTNSTNIHRIGNKDPNVASGLLDGYMSEINLIDGQALDASYFGQIDTNSGQWIPKQRTITDYGKNGFYLNFSNSASLGADGAPIASNHTAANNWTPTNLAAHDQVLDSPTNNFPILSPIDTDPYPSYRTFSNGSLAFSTANGTYFYHSRVTIPFPRTMKWYWEGSPTNSNAGPVWGLVSTAASATSDASIGFYNKTPSFSFRQDGYFWQNGVNSGSYSALANNDVAMLAFDPVNGYIWAGKNGTWFNSGNPSNGTGYIATIASGYHYAAFMETGNPSAGNINFGQGGQTGLTYDAASGGRFKYTPPAGFKALCTANLPAPAIKKPNQHFTPLLYTGDGVDGRSVTGLGFQPDLVWIKSRVNAYDHRISDSVRGGGKYLASNQTYDEATCQSGVVGSFLSDGFTLTKNAGSVAGVNDSNGANNYVAWCWKAGGTAVANSVGTTSSLVSSNSTAQFSIAKISHVQGVATGFGHGLSAAPDFVLIKNSSNANQWWIRHKNFASSYYLMQFTTGVPLNYGSEWLQQTATTFTLDSNHASGNYIAYLWAEVPSFSKFDSYTGNGSSDGPFVYCGFKPRWLMWKRTDSTGNWHIHDTGREAYNGSPLDLLGNSAGSESLGVYPFDFLSNGFKVRSNDAEANATNGTYIFAAFAEAPFKYATAR